MESCQQLVQQCHQCLGFDCFLKTKHQLIGKTWILKDKECIKQKSHNKKWMCWGIVHPISLYFEEVWLSCLPMFARVCLFSIHFAVPLFANYSNPFMEWDRVWFRAMSRKYVLMNIQSLAANPLHEILRIDSACIHIRLLLQSKAKGTWVSRRLVPFPTEPFSTSMLMEGKIVVTYTVQNWQVMFCASFASWLPFWQFSPVKRNKNTALEGPRPSHFEWHVMM